MTENPRGASGGTPAIPPFCPVFQSICTATLGGGFGGRYVEALAGRQLALLLTGLLLAAPSSLAQPGAYTFLGDMVGFETTESGASIHCRPEARLEIAFLDPGTVRAGGGLRVGVGAARDPRGLRGGIVTGVADD